VKKDDMVMEFGQCVFCIHNRGRGKCDVFPEEVPLDIVLNKVDHRRPIKGDHGIRFELDPKLKKLFEKQKPFKEFDKE
jgi:hypothetical protein